MLKKGDKVLGIIFIIFVFGWIGSQYLLYRNIDDNKVVEIKIEGELYERIPLKELETARIIHINNDYGINDIQIDAEGAQMIHATCPDQVCVHTGKITNQGPIIACLPHRLSVEIVGQMEDGLDAISQ